MAKFCLKKSLYESQIKSLELPLQKKVLPLMVISFWRSPIKLKFFLIRSKICSSLKLKSAEFLGVLKSMFLSL